MRLVLIIISILICVWSQGQAQNRCAVGGIFDGPTSFPIQIRENSNLTVVFHLFEMNEDEIITDELILNQVEQLNADFNALNEDINLVPEIFQNDIGQAKINFVLANKDSNDEFTTGINRYNTSIQNIADEKSSDGEHLIKFSTLGGADAWDPQFYINIWIGNSSGFLGKATNPNSAGEITDGIILNTNVVGVRPDDPSPYNLGRTLTHEMGHYLGLNHLWGSEQGCETDDGLGDTPEQSGPHEGCPEFPDISCGSADMTMNFMDFSNDACLYFFTKDQVELMQNTVMTARSSLLENNSTLAQDTFEDAFEIVHDINRMQIRANREISGLSSLSIYDIQGRLVQKEIVNNLFFHTLNTNFYTTGVYILLIESSSVRKSVLFGKVN